MLVQKIVLKSLKQPSYRTHLSFMTPKLFDYGFKRHTKTEYIANQDSIKWVFKQVVSNIEIRFLYQKSLKPFISEDL